jgi:DNA-binding NarL/FixJ family response regulator
MNIHMSIRILLADDHPLIREGIRTILATEPAFTLVGEGTDGVTTQRLCQELLPDILLLDLHMPGAPAMETLAFVRHCCPTVKVLVLSAYDDDAYVRGAMAAGVAGYVLKEDAVESVVQAIHIVMQGGTWLSRGVVAKLAQPTTLEAMQQEMPDLNEQEQHILKLLAQGQENSQIADELALAEQTVRNYISRLYTKLEVRTRGEAIIWAREHGFGQHR